MRNQARALTVVAISAAFVGGAYAADQAVTAPSKDSAAQAVAYNDAGKLSTDGAAAFRDIHMTRLAIFNANPSDAKTLIAKAQSELEKAKTDNTSFTKAEADLKQPATENKTAAAMPPTNEADMKKPVTWLPVDGQLAVDDNFVATPEKAKAVDEANKSLAKGDQKGALDKLKLADVNVSFTMAILPLAATTSDVDKAVTLIGDGKFYEANGVLKQAEDGVRFDMADMNEMPKANPAQQASQATPSTPATKTTK